MTITEKIQKEEEKETNGKLKDKSIVAGIDINKLVKKAQESYDKKEKGLASQLSTGVTIVRPEEDKDFVVWTRGDHWKELTHLRGIPFGKVVQISGRPDSGKS